MEAIQSQSWESPSPNLTYAYVWYTGNFKYLCSALVAMRILKDLRTNSALKSVIKI
jgi:hypothetical protein